MNQKWKTSLLLPASLLLLSAPEVSQAHEPIFGIGPHTIYKDGIGIGAEYEKEQTVKGKEQTLNYDLSYGLTADWSVTAEVPQKQKVEGEQQVSGLGDLTLKTKWRFYRKDYPEGRQDQVALLAAVKLPTGDQSTGSGSRDYLAGITVGRESRTLYYFTDLRYRKNGTNNKNLQQGDAWLYGASFGFRPWQTEYWEPDLVLLLELSGKQQAQSRLNGSSLQNTGGHTASLGPSFLLSYQNWMIVGGVAFPVRQALNGSQDTEKYKIALGIERHL